MMMTMTGEEEEEEEEGGGDDDSAGSMQKYEGNCGEWSGMEPSISVAIICIKSTVSAILVKVYRDTLSLSQERHART